ncbi:MAG TPA: CCA tRNA nucleotidyltransferase [Acidisoma sp.]|uniref:CCA tRNA nucleotidyltransferase n=1 Tax=Acidisoma sp. TaxID=1872115 RepID=UPI002C20A85A|nr:CCA tRNA nucleotidyltransferase [Acidisoma sp.]HTI02604.1 CCA tRNA nucleotidyltransferase [Acidisoma sp.]
MVRIDPAPLLALPGVRPVLAALPGARIVGGAVRDLLAGRPVADVDVTTPSQPQATIRALKAAGLRAIPTGIAHGTVTALAEGGSIEVTTLRRDVETDGRHAVVAFTEDFAEDAARRDFTINAMSLGADGTLYDYFEGRSDLEAGRLRFVGTPAARIAEDYLRVLRFFRFQSRYGRLAPDEETAAALRAAAGKLDTLSAERLWSEMSKILSAKDPGDGLALMAELGIFAVLLPEAAPDWPARLDRLAEADAPAEPLLRLAALIGDARRADRLALRWKLSNAERERLSALLTGDLPAADADAVVLRQALAETAADVLIGRSFLRHLPGEAAAVFRRKMALIPEPVFPLQGRDAVAIGLQPGPALGAALRAVRAWWIERGCVDDADACRAELARLAGVAGRPAS